MIERSRGLLKTESLFTLKRIIKGALGMSVVYGLAILSQAAGIVKAYPDITERLKLIMTFKHSTGLAVLYGSSENLDGSVKTYVMWRIMGTLIVISAIWAITVTTRLQRSDEETGRSEFVLAKATTPFRNLLNTLGIAGFVIVVQLLITAIIAFASTATKGVELSFGDCLMLALTILTGAVMFVAISTLTSQLYETRRRAAMAASAVLVIMFILRGAIGVKPDLSWAKYVSPLTWLENVQPLTDKNYLWFLPIALIIGLCFALSFAIIRRRDYGASSIKERVTVRHTSRFLGSVFQARFLFMRSTAFVWLLIVVVYSAFMSSLAKTVADALKDSSQFKNTLSHITGVSSSQAIKVFLGVVMFIGIMLIMLAAVNLIGGMRSEEANGQLDAVLVRPTSRLEWWWSHASLTFLAVVAISFSTAIASWLVLPRDSGVSFMTALEAGVNIIFPVVMIMGLCLLLFGLRPQLTTVVGYGVIGWSFLVEIIIPMLWPNSKVLDLSVFHHIPLVPAVNIDWTKSLVMLALGIALAVVGFIAFQRRDLVGE